MTTSPNELQLIPIELVCRSSEPPLRAKASLTAFSAQRCRVETEAPLPLLPPDTAVSMVVNHRQSMEIAGLVESHAGRAITVRIVDVNHNEKRYFPREYGGIDMRWKRVDDGSREAAQHAWRRGLFAVDNDEGWSTPEPFMNFSASGFRFRDSTPCQKGDLVLVTFRLQGQSVWHRGTATVVRCEAPPNEDTAEIAIKFDDMDPASIEALADYTLDRQLTELASHALPAD